LIGQNKATKLLLAIAQQKIPHEVLTANPEVRLSLDHEDGLLFFGQREIKVQRIV